MPLADDSGEEGMSAMLVDSHTHLLRLEVSPEEAVRSAAEAGVVAVVNVGTDVEDSQRGAELAAVLPNVYSTAGIHPHNAGTYTAADLEALAELSESPGIVALGVVGGGAAGAVRGCDLPGQRYEVAVGDPLPQRLRRHDGVPRERPRPNRPPLLRRRRPRGPRGEGTRLLCRPCGKRHLQRQRDGQGAPPARRGAHPD